AVVDVLVDKTRRAADAVDARSICVGGGVAANSLLRERIVLASAEDGRAAFVPSRAMCTDNAAMVGATAWYRLSIDGPTGLDAARDPNRGRPFEGAARGAPPRLMGPARDNGHGPAWGWGPCAREEGGVGAPPGIMGTGKFYLK